jgi:hypothetical protein
VTYRYSFCARCWLCWHTLKKRTHSVTCRMCSDFSILIGSTVLSRTHSIRREYQPHNSNFTLLLDLNTELRTTPKSKEQQDASYSRYDVHLHCGNINSATCSLKGRKFLCFEGRISVRLQAHYLSLQLRPCQHKT